MFRKNYFTFLLAIALFTVSGVAVSAQIVPIRGKVELQKADGTTAPVAEATVDALRPGASAKFLSTKTNKKGEFGFAGFPIGTTLTLSISAPNISPQIAPGVNSGDEGVVIIVREGDGKRLTEEEVRQGANAASINNSTGKLTDEQKKAQEERLKLEAEYEVKKKEADNANAVIDAAIQEGNKAYREKNYDVAIVKYDEGYRASPDFVGSAPVMLNNKVAALIARATIKYNQSVKLTDAAAKSAARAEVKKDLETALTDSERSLAIMKSSAPTPETQKSYEDNKLRAIVNRKEIYKLMSETGVERSKGKETLAAFQEYLALETDAKKKSAAQVSLAVALQDSNEFDLAIAEYEKVLAVDANNPDALAGISLSLVNVGYVTSETNAAKAKEQFQQAANYLQKFLEVAPDTHKYKEEAKGIIEILKSEQKVAPQRNTRKKN